MTDGARSRPGTKSGTPPHAATVPRGSAAQRQTRQAASAPHPATVPRAGAAKAPVPAIVEASPPGKKPRPAAKKRVAEPLAIDVKVLERNWNGAVSSRPHRALTLKKRGGGEAGEPWEFECLGESGRVNYDDGRYDVAHVAIQPGKRARWTEYWFMIVAEGRVVDAPARAFEREKTAQGLSKLPPDYDRPIRALLAAMYAGTVG